MDSVEESSFICGRYFLAEGREPLGGEGVWGNAPPPPRKFGVIFILKKILKCSEMSVGI